MLFLNIKYDISYFITKLAAKSQEYDLDRLKQYGHLVGIRKPIKGIPDTKRIAAKGVSHKRGREFGYGNQA